MRQIVRRGDRLGDAEIEQAHLIVQSDLDIARLDVAMYNGAFPAIDIRLVRMQGFELVADLTRVTRRSSGVQPVFSPQNIGQILSFHVLHHDVEAIVHFPVVIDLEDSRVERVQLALNRRATPLRFHHHLCVRIVRMLDNLQHHAPVGLGVECKIYVRHAPPELLDDLVFSELFKVRSRVHRSPG
jgi:hypothetical protein